MWWTILLFVIAFISTTIFIFRYFWLRRSMEAKLQTKRVDKERRKEVSEVKLHFLINISHELRTPLTLILTPIQRMLDKASDRWLYRQLEYVQKNTSRLLHLMNQLMDYWCAESGVFSLKVRLNLIHNVVEGGSPFYERLAQHKRIAYDLSPNAEGREIFCDPDYMELIVNNLLSNAFKYTGEGKSTTMTLKEENHELLLQVRDTGSGISINRQGKISERSYQADNKHLSSGTRLLLVQRPVELRHGRIELKNEEGIGSTLSIYLPTEESTYLPEEKLVKSEPIEEQRVYTTSDRDVYAIDTENEEISEGETTSDEAAVKDGQSKESILIVEDSPDIRQCLCERLGKTYHTLKAKNGEEASSIVEKQEVGLILTDVMMPVTDDLQLRKQIKQNLHTYHIPVIILSAKIDLKEQLEGLQVGTDSCIPKPFSMIMIATKIKNLSRTHYRVIEHCPSSLKVGLGKVALNPLGEELLREAIVIVEKHMDSVEFSIEIFAREMCMSRSNLHIKMKASMGESVNGFIRKIHLNQACKLLKEGEYIISEISGMVGFNTPSYFATSFRKYFDYLPSGYGKQSLGSYRNTNLQKDEIELSFVLPFYELHRFESALYRGVSTLYPDNNSFDITVSYFHTNPIPLLPLIQDYFKNNIA